MQRHVFLGRSLLVFFSGFPVEGLSCNAVDWLAESVTNPSAASLSFVPIDEEVRCVLNLVLIKR